MVKPARAALRLRRSLLFVPGSEPRKLEKARTTEADAVVLDLEDAVAPAEKAEARAHVAEALRVGFGSAEAIVRVNPPATSWFEEDLETVIAAGGRAVMLSKAESAAEIESVTARLDGLEEGDAEDRAALFLLVESPIGIVNALALERASARVVAMCFGHADFSLEMGLTEADASRGIVYHARCELMIAARACGIAPIDVAHLAIKDDAAFREDAILGARLGYEGKLCIHPRQVEIANEIHTPRREEIDAALRVVEASERARAEGRGVFTLDGRMIDAPIVAAERRVLERARRAGVLR